MLKGRLRVGNVAQLVEPIQASMLRALGRFISSIALNERKKERKK